MATVYPKIGSEEFTAGSTPHVVASVLRLERKEREGIDGTQFREVGKRAAPVRWITERDTAGAAAKIATYKGLSGTIQTITNADGSTISAVVELIGEVKVKPVVKGVGGVEGASGTKWVMAEWLIQAVS